MLYKIVPRNIAFAIDADSPEDAMVGFAWAMDSDMNMYFKAVPVDDKKHSPALDIIDVVNRGILPLIPYPPASHQGVFGLQDI